MVRSPAEDTGRVGESSASSSVEERGQEEGAESGQRDANGAACFRNTTAPALVAGFPTVHVHHGKSDRYQDTCLCSCMQMWSQFLV